MAGSKFRWQGEKVTKAVKEAGISAVMDVAEVILKEADKEIPHATGTMERSGSISPFNRIKNCTIISYNTPYALKQHEDLTLRHPDPTNPLSSSGRKAKFLEDPFNRNKGKVMKLAQVRINKVLK